jgi:hypothetical protein
LFICHSAFAQHRPPPAPSAPEPSSASSVSQPQKDPSSNYDPGQINEKLKQQVKEKEDKIAELKSGKLIRFGLTAGFAASVTFGVGIERQTNPHLGSLVYLMVHPAYWMNNGPRNAYCSSSWVGDGSQEPSEAASAVARNEAKRRLDAIVAEIQANIPEDQTIEKLMLDLEIYEEDKSKNKNAQQKIYAEARRLSKLDPFSLEYTTGRANLSQAIANYGYAPHWKSSCKSYRIGLWLGKPLGYESNVRLSDRVFNATDNSKIVSDRTTRQREINPIFAAGVGFTPSSYLSVLAGYTLSTAPELNEKNEKIRDRNIHGLMFGVGGNLDILTLLTKP